MITRSTLLGALGAALAISLLSVGVVRAQAMSFPGGSSDAQTLDGIDSTAFVTNGAAANTIGVVMNVTGADITSTSGTAMRITASGAADLELGSGNGVTMLLDSAGTARGSLLMSATAWRLGQIDNYGAINGNNSGEGANVGANRDVAATVIAGAIGDTLASDGSAVRLLAVYGGGHAASFPQAAACAAGVLALDPTADRVNLNANTAACAVTLGEVNAVIGTEVTIMITTASAVGGVTFPDVVNVVVSDAACDTTGLQVDGKAVCTYVDAVDDHYVCKCQA